MKLKIILSIFILTLNLEAIIIIEPVDIGSKPNGYSSEIEIDTSGSQGNTDTQKINLGFLTNYATDDSYSFLNTDYSYGESDNKKNIDKYFIHFRTLRRISDKDYIAEMFYQIEGNKFKNLTSRQLFGVSVRFKLDKDFYLSNGIMSVIEKVEDEEKKTYARGNIYLSYKKSFELKLPVTTIYHGYYQPKIDKIADYHIIQNLVLSMPITEAIQLKFKAEHKYDSLPPVDIKRGDFSQKISVSYKF